MKIQFMPHREHNSSQLQTTTVTAVYSAHQPLCLDPQGTDKFTVLTEYTAFGS